MVHVANPRTWERQWDRGTGSSRSLSGSIASFRPAQSYERSASRENKQKVWFKLKVTWSPNSYAIEKKNLMIRACFYSTRLLMNVINHQHGILVFFMSSLLEKDAHPPGLVLREEWIYGRWASISGVRCERAGEPLEECSWWHLIK